MYLVYNNIEFLYFRWYSMEDIYESWKLLLAAGPTLSSLETYRFDLVDVTRQALVNTGQIFYSQN